MLEIVPTELQATAEVEGGTFFFFKSLRVQLNIASLFKEIDNPEEKTEEKDDVTDDQENPAHSRRVGTF